MRFVLGADDKSPVVAHLAAALKKKGHRVTTLPVTAWGDVARKVATRVADGDADFGIVCCYTGTGVSIAANKVPGVRAALCVDAATAAGARKWNDANVLALSLRLLTPTLADEIVDAWLGAKYAGTEGESLRVIRSAEKKRT